MKYFLFMAQGIADEPLEDWGGRTPLEMAKTPVMDGLSKKGKTGLVSFAPRSLRPSSEVACLAALGYNPLEFYTGIAPLDALSFGIIQDDFPLIFRCDLVTALDEILVDSTAGGISEREASLLIGALNEKLSTKSMKFYVGSGYKNILLVTDQELSNALEESECSAPSEILRRPLEQVLPRGKKKNILIDLMVSAKEILENHEINRVRIDLGENPANRIWLWGQGRRPKLPAFKQRHPLNGALLSEANFAKGLAKAVGFKVKNFPFNGEAEEDFIFIYTDGSEKITTDLKEKIKQIEDFDILIGNVLKRAPAHGEFRVGVTTDRPVSLVKKMAAHGPVPFLISGAGVESDTSAFFNERVASQSELIFDEGPKFLEYFLK